MREGVFYSDDNLAGLYRYVEGDGASWEKLEKIEGVLPEGADLRRRARVRRRGLALAWEPQQG